jgi:hypothetical protein
MTGIGDHQDLDEPHFGMYISVHDYAAEKLDLLGADVRRAAEERRTDAITHGFGSEETLEPLTGREGLQRRRTLALALDNLVAAFRRAVGRGDVETMASTYRAAWEVLEVRGPAAAGIELGSQLPELHANDGDLLVAGHLARGRALWRSGQTARAPPISSKPSSLPPARTATGDAKPSHGRCSAASSIAEARRRKRERLSIAHCSCIAKSAIAAARRTL